MENLGNALVITVIGMGLVFFGIVVLWGMMSLLMRFTAENPSPADGEEADSVETTPESSAVAENVSDRKRRAAVAAVAVALALQQQQQQPVPETNHVSAWQMRSRQFTKRGKR